MGNHFQRLILEPDTPVEMAEELAVTMRQSGHGAEFVYSSFGTRRYRKPHLVAARDAKLRFLEIWSASADEIVEAAEQVLGPDGFLYREWDDEFVDTLIPNRQWLATAYPGLDLTWLTEFSNEGPFKLDEVAFYSIPSNPPEVSVRTGIGIGTDQFPIALPGEEHPCPKCGHKHTSKFSARQCRNCAYGYFPFEWIEDAVTIIDVPLDGYGVGRCNRDVGTHGTCQVWRNFTNRIEQCRRCGQLLRGYSDRHDVELADNEAEVEILLEALSEKLWSYYGSTYSKTSLDNGRQSSAPATVSGTAQEEQASSPNHEAELAQAEYLFSRALVTRGQERRQFYLSSAEIFERLDSEGKLPDSHRQQAADARKLSRRFWWLPFGR